MKSATISTIKARNMTKMASLSDWWTESDVKAFDAAGKKLIAQYDAYKIFPDASVKGEFTLGENIGDLAGSDHSVRRLPDVAERQGAAGYRRNDR